MAIKPPGPPFSGAAWRFFPRALLAILILVNIGIGAALTSRWFMADTIDSPPMTRHDYLDLSLSLLEVILTALAIIIAIGALFAYFDVRRAAERMAEQTARDLFARWSQEQDGTVTGKSAATTTEKPEVPTPEALGEGVETQREGDGV